MSYRTTLRDLPEFCLSLILSFLPPRCIDRLACTNRLFRDAAASDVVWSAKLPGFYSDLLKDCDEPLLSSSSKKSLYESLCQGAFLKGRLEAIWLDRATGSLLRGQGARALCITWGSEKMYWNWLSGNGSSIGEIAVLCCVCWLEIRGEMKCALPVGRYSLCWKLSFVRRSFGWSNSPITFTLDTDDGQHVQMEQVLDPDQGEPWTEAEGGEFTVRETERGTGFGFVELKYSLQEIRRLNWKRGLVVSGVVVKPSQLSSASVPEQLTKSAGNDPEMDEIADWMGLDTGAPVW